MIRFVLCALLIGCTGRRAAAPESGKAPDGAAIVIRGSSLSGNLVDALRSRTATMIVTRVAGDCPRIQFRGRRTMRDSGNPGLYVDGTPMRDMCALELISSTDVDFVEMYPSGNTSRAGIQRNPFGLILVYRHRQ